MMVFERRRSGESRAFHGARWGVGIRALGFAAGLLPQTGPAGEPSRE